MKASELRVGNRIYDAVNKREGIVSRLNWGHDYPITYFYGNAYEFTPTKGEGIEGIPLTEEWLLKMSFQKEMTYWQTTVPISGEVFVYERYDETQAQIYYRGKYLGICQRLQYVHQLMNFFYALTGTELTLTENKEG